MIRIIEGKTYNTDTAELLARISHSMSVTDFSHHDTGLYRTKKGAYFLAGEGGPLSMWAKHENDTSRGGSGIRLITNIEAREILERENEHTALSKYFEIEQG